ncbi:MAG: transcription elongation factor GreA [bacterium]
MDTREVYLTQEGFEKFTKELEDLTTNGRKKIAEMIRTAKEYGDLSENSEYADAKDQQVFIEGRIAELEHILKNVSIIDDTHSNCSVVNMGCSVNVEVNKGEREFKIVGSAEADPEKDWISNESPIGKALLGKKTGEVIEVEIPAGKIQYKINKIK